MSDPNGPTVRRRRLGLELRRLREQARLDQADAAKHLECSTSKISRLEKGQGLAKLLELRSLLDLYNVTGEGARNKILDIHRRAAEPGWWEQAEYEEVLPSGLGVYVGLEHDARQVQCWELGYVPGLLQTPEYARAVLAATNSDPEDLDRLVEVRMQRQRRITAETGALELCAIIDETALLRPVGGAEVMHDQVKALVVASQRPNVTIQVYPLSKGAHPGVRGAFSLLEFGPSDPRIGCVDSPAGNNFLETTRRPTLCSRAGRPTGRPERSAWPPDTSPTPRGVIRIPARMVPQIRKACDEAEQRFTVRRPAAPAGVAPSLVPAHRTAPGLRLPCRAGPVPDARVRLRAAVGHGSVPCSPSRSRHRITSSA